MILRALYDYYNRCADQLPQFGTANKQIGFVIVIDKDGHFLRFEDRRIDKDNAQTFQVPQPVGRSSGVSANYLYDNSEYTLGYSDKRSPEQSRKYLNAFKQLIEDVYETNSNNKDLRALHLFYQQDSDYILEQISTDPLWDEITKKLNKKYSLFSFLIEGDIQIVAEKSELISLRPNENNADEHICLITGEKAPTVTLTTQTMIPGSQAVAKLVSFQVKSGYDSYGKEQCDNAPIGEQAEFAYSTALLHLLDKKSRNKFLIGDRTYLFWASINSEAAQNAEESVFSLFGIQEKEDDPNRNIEQVRKVFSAIYSGQLETNLDDTFYILGLAPNAARIAVVYWAEIPLKDFAGKLLKHFEDLTIVDTRKDKTPYFGLRNILSAVSLDGKLSSVSPNLPEALTKSIFEGTPYPYTLYNACLRRIRAESASREITIARAAIIKAFLNRQNNNQNISIMLDKTNTNQGYLCGRLFSVLVKIQEEASGNTSIRERYMNSASTTPAAVFATIMNLSAHHLEKLNQGRVIQMEQLQQEIISKLPADGFPAHLDLQDQGRFFVGYYHQRQDFFAKKSNDEKETNE
ncbi:MAG: type I-C CRISPR-associated protein Cas8c/Csd1 [Paludibacteraceae bacterium]|nr:type I-C CRISPR-associated protein Cas8c/Csd1 [Paludibacteraceae bacterium]